MVYLIFDIMHINTALVSFLGYVQVLNVTMNSFNKTIKDLKIISQVNSGAEIGLAAHRSPEVMIGTSGGVEAEIATWRGIQICCARSLDGGHAELRNPSDPHCRLVTRSSLQIESSAKLIVRSAMTVKCSGIQSGVIALEEIGLGCGSGSAAHALDVAMLQ